MKKINEVMQNVTRARQSDCGTNVANRSKTCDVKPEISERVIDRLFLKFKLLYGHRWNSLFPNESVIHAYKKQWAKVLTGLSNQEIAKAVEQVECGFTEFSKFPPNVLEFRKLCKSSKPPYYRDYQCLKLEYKSDPDIAAVYLKKMREVLSGAKNS